MGWLNISADVGLWGLLVSSFLAATLLPGGSEAVLFALLGLHPEVVWPALGVATLGNTLGGMTSYAMGRWLPKSESVGGEKAYMPVRRWGAPVLLFAWAPLIGDGLCLAAGWLRLNWLACALFMAVGKLARYWAVAQGAIG